LNETITAARYIAKPRLYHRCPDCKEGISGPEVHLICHYPIAEHCQEPESIEEGMTQPKALVSFNLWLCLGCASSRARTNKLLLDTLVTGAAKSRN
jgi:hypothetical protein